MCSTCMWMCCRYNTCSTSCKYICGFATFVVFENQINPTNDTIYDVMLLSKGKLYTRWMYVGESLHVSIIINQQIDTIRIWLVAKQNASVLNDYYTIDIYIYMCVSITECSSISNNICVCFNCVRVLFVFDVIAIMRFCVSDLRWIIRFIQECIETNVRQIACSVFFFLISLNSLEHVCIIINLIFEM